MTTKPDAAKAAAGTATPVIPVADEYDGQGGAYETDPATGVRRLISRTQPAAPVQPAAQPGDDQ